MTSERRARRPLSEAARTAAGGAALTAAVGLAGALLAQRSLAAEGAQAVMVEWGVSHLGVAWNEAPAPAGTRLAGRALTGVAIGLAAGGLVLAFARATGAVTSITPLLSVVGLGLALLHSSLLAVRDELLLHGLVLRLLHGHDARRGQGGHLGRQGIVCLLACGAASAAWAFGTAEGAALPLASLVAEALAGVSFGALWLGGRGAWMACGAHAAWTLATRGILLSRTTSGAWGGGDGGLLGGWAASVALVPVCAALVLWARAATQKETSAPPVAVG